MTRKHESEALMIPVHNPPHHGEVLREDILPAIRLTATDLAVHLGYPREQFMSILHCHASISADIAVRLELAGLGSARHWMAQQAAYDLWQAQHESSRLCGHPRLGEAR